MISIHPLNKIKIAGTIAVIAVVALIVGIKMPDRVIASSTDNVHGWLWSDMPNTPNHVFNAVNQAGGRGFGYISMNSTEGVQCSLNQNNSGCPGYGVRLDMTSGELSGQAWSPNAGWLDFDAGFPSSAPGGTAPTSAKVMPACWNDDLQTSCKVIGWARFSSGGSAQSGGWNGWVSLNSDSTITPQYHVYYDKTTGIFSGQAWGEKDAGWIDFGNVYSDPKNATDLCDNIAGAQGTVPSGMNRIQLNVLTPNGGMTTKHFCLDMQANLTCIDTATGNTVTYPASDPMPKICEAVPDPDLCENISGTQYTVPTGLVQVKLGVFNPNSGTLTWKFMCFPGTHLLTCHDKDGNVITYQAGQPKPAACEIDDDPTDLCSNLPGTQSVLPVFTQGIWYNDPNNDKICTKMPNPPILGCTSPAATNYNPAATVDDGSCVFDENNWCELHPDDPSCLSGPLNPIYIEN